MNPNTDMSTKDVTDAANVETANNVVPPGWPGLIIYCIRHLGPAVVLASAMTAVSLYGINKVYTDMQALNGSVLIAFNDRTKVDAEHVATLQVIQNTLHSIDQKLTRVKIEP